MEQVQQLIGGQDIIISVKSTSQHTSESTGTIPPNDPHPAPEISFQHFFLEQIERLKRNGNLRTTETYQVTYRKFSTFCQHQDLSFDAVNSDLVKDFESFLKNHNLSMNTISFYMRVLRSVYRKGVEQGLTDDKQPFVHVYTGQAKTDKRAISIDAMRRIKHLKIEDRQVRFARDLFLFSFYTRGMSFVDIAYLRRSDIRDGILAYKRRKTGQSLSIRWEPAMQEIIDNWQETQSPYLLPIIRKQNGKERNQYRHVQTIVNSHLRTVGEMAGIASKLTMYCARHSWATIARQMNVPMDVISHGMGHTSERTTEIYLKSVDNHIVDQANLSILSMLNDEL